MKRFFLKAAAAAAALILTAGISSPAVYGLRGYAQTHGAAAQIQIMEFTTGDRYQDVLDKVLTEHPDCIINSGCAGGVGKGLHVCDIVVGSQTAYHDVWCGEGNEWGQVQGLPARFDADPKMLQCAKKVAESSKQRVLSGLICTGDQFISDKATQAEIKTRFPEALACEMESAAIAHTCLLRHVPFLSVRVVSDTPGNTDDHQQQWSDFLTFMSDKSFHFVKSFLEQL